MRTEVSTQPIKFSVVRTPTADLLVGQQRISQKGQNGVRQVSAQVTVRDGRELSRRVVQVKILKHSVPQIVLIGTRKVGTAPSSRASSTPGRAPQRRSSSASRYRRPTRGRDTTRRRSTRRRGRESSLPIVESPLP